MNIVIIGAYGGIGKELSYALHKNHNLFLGAKDTSKIDNLVFDITQDGLYEENTHSINGAHVDASNFDSMKTFFEKANGNLNSIDCVINCVGSLLLKPAHLTSEVDLDNVFKTNVYSCFSSIKHSFKYLRKNGGSIVFFSSAASKVGLKNHEAISSAKGAISSLVLAAASTYANYNIRVNAIAPGLVSTPLTQKIVANETSLEYSKNLHGLKRIGNPENFIPIVEALIDNKSDWITGQTISVDGGLSNVK
tara:strand:+ start:7404 stop:8153 length:750 start_codon:yes stop_codon:yes gene_type:complete